METIDNLKTLVKIRNDNRVGSGVLLATDTDNVSIVLTAKHNIKDKDKEISIYDIDGDKLAIIDKIFSPDKDIAIFILSYNCQHILPICIEVNDRVDAITVGYPLALASAQKKHTDYEGDIYYEHEHVGTETFYMNLTKNVPKEPSKEHIQGFSGGPVFEFYNNKKNIRLKGIITNQYDKNFSFNKVKCQKISSILPLIEERYNIKCTFLSIDEPFLEEINKNLGDDIEALIYSTDIADKLKNIDLLKLKEESYLYITKLENFKGLYFLPLNEQRKIVKKIIITKIISAIYLKPDFEKVIYQNPIKSDKKNIYSISILNDVDCSYIIRELLTNKKYSKIDSSILFLYTSNQPSVITKIKRSQIGNILENFEQSSTALTKDVSKKDSRIIKDFVEEHHKNKTSFSLIDIDWLVTEILNTLMVKKISVVDLDDDEVFQEITGIINEIDKV